MSEKEMDMIDKIMRFEGGEMSHEEVVDFFQQLIDNGMAWKLQGSYGRMAQRLIESGHCHANKPEEKETTDDHSSVS